MPEWFGNEATGLGFPIGRPASLSPPDTLHEGKSTTRYDVVDAKGNAVPVICTLNDWFGVHRLAGATSIVMNDETTGFTAKPGPPPCSGWCRQGQWDCAGKDPAALDEPYHCR